MKKIIEKIIASSTFFLCFLAICASVLSIPPHPIITTPITLPPTSVVPEEVLEVSFYINRTNQVTLENISIQTKTPVVITTDASDFKMQITDGASRILFSAGILVFPDSSGISQQYYAVPYPIGARFLNFYYRNSIIARYDVPQESSSSLLYLIVGIVAIVLVVLMVAIYLIRKNYTIQV